jgi:hypothetical protein
VRIRIAERIGWMARARAADERLPATVVGGHEFVCSRIRGVETAPGRANDVFGRMAVDSRLQVRNRNGW